MPGPSTIPRGNIALTMILGVPLTPASVAANTTVEQTFTIQGIQLGDFINVTKPTTQAGLALGNSRVTAANTIGIAFINDTAAPIVPTAAEVYLVGVDRLDNPTQPLPTAIV